MGALEAMSGRENASAESSIGIEPSPVDSNSSILDLLIPVLHHWRLLIAAPCIAALLGLGVAWMVPPTFTGRTVFLPPQQQNQASVALAGLGALGGLAAGAGGVKTPADQLAALLQSVTLSDRIIDRFSLLTVYDVDLRVDAREKLQSRVRVMVGKKDGLIAVQVDDRSPERAANMANAYVEELRRLTSSLALTEAQQRRQFFEVQVKATRTALTKAQRDLESSGFTAGTLRAEPKAAAEAYARLRAEIASAEVRLQALRGTLKDSAPEMQQLIVALTAMRSQLAAQEMPLKAAGPDYIGKFREFKYQEALFETFSRQYELARIDEGREGGLIQVVDAATAPERKSAPKRALIAVLCGISTFLLLALGVMVRHSWRGAAADPAIARKLQQMRAAI